MARKKKIKCPTQMELLEPVFNALKALGGSATVGEIYDQVILDLKLPDSAIDEPHSGTGQTTELQYQLAWARTKLKAYGAIANTARGVWMLTPDYMSDAIVTRADVTEFYKNKRLKGKTQKEADQILKDADPSNDGDGDVPEELEPWKTELYGILKAMDPYAFERLSMLLLRECGFTQVSVTKKSNDGGIDGSGKLRINGIFSFKVAFQCKRYSGSVSAGDIRDFRGSLTADAEKGVFITTGTFTQSARKEAADPAKTPSIDLMDGEEFINKLIECRIGVSEKTIFEVDKEFFAKV